MPAFTIYDVATGEVVQVYDGHENDLVLNTPAGCSAISGKYDDAKYVVENGRAKRKPIHIEEMRAAATARAEAEYREQAFALFDPALYVTAEKARREGGEIPGGVVEMEAAILALAEERKALRAAVMKEKTQKGLRNLVPGIIADNRFK